jgi:hypothetical protein
MIDQAIAEAITKRLSNGIPLPLGDRLKSYFARQGKKIVLVEEFLDCRGKEEADPDGYTHVLKPFLRCPGCDTVGLMVRQYGYRGIPPRPFYGCLLCGRTTNHPTRSKSSPFSDMTLPEHVPEPPFRPGRPPKNIWGAFA